LDDVKQAVDTAVVGCTPWVDWRSPSSASGYFYSNAAAGGDTKAAEKQAVAAEGVGSADGQSRRTTGQGDVEVVPHEQWPAEYRDAPVPSPPNLTRSVMMARPYGYATYETRVPTLASTTRRPIIDDIVADGSAEQVTAWVADTKEPGQKGSTVVSDMDL
jgi:hypothetical protein